jgi:hypothetical protein
VGGLHLHVAWVAAFSAAVVPTAGHTLADPVPVALGTFEAGHTPPLVVVVGDLG